MKRRLSMFVLLGAALALAITGCGGTRLSEKTLKYTEKQTNNFGFNDTAPKSNTGPNQEPSLSNGDIITFTADLLDSSKKKVGRIDAECTVTEGKGGFNASYATCVGGATLPGGQLALSVNGKAFNQNPTKGEITGGTGDYEGATGTFTSASHGQNSSISDDAFHFWAPK